MSSGWYCVHEGSVACKYTVTSTPPLDVTYKVVENLTENDNYIRRYRIC